MIAWVTGAAGSVGKALTDRLNELGWNVTPTDLSMDVRDATLMDQFAGYLQPDVTFHLAGAKHAPDGELDPAGVVATNVDGTRNVLNAKSGKVVLASTCKAADPETAYGASKLLAERMVLNAGGVVARFFNVRETSGNVFEIWRNADTIEATPCWRYFISLEQAVDLLIKCAVRPSGRYAVHPGSPVYMPHLAGSLYPDRERVLIAPRRGDRIREPLHAASETAVLDEGLLRITSPHDPC